MREARVLQRLEHPRIPRLVRPLGARLRTAVLRLERAVSELRALPAEGMLEGLLAAVRAWRLASVPQQDDVTLLVIEVLEG